MTDGRCSWGHGHICFWTVQRDRGDRVNVRALPNLNSKVVGVLSNEVVKFDQKRFENSQEEQIKAPDPISDWTPVILPNRNQGYFYNRYASRSLDYRAIFRQISGKWQITEMPGGELRKA